MENFDIYLFDKDKLNEKNFNEITDKIGEKSIVIIKNNENIKNFKNLKTITKPVKVKDIIEA